MKAKELLKWIVNNDVSTESMGTIEVDEKFDFNGYFGYEPAVEKVRPGEYLYVYTDSVLDVDLQRLEVAQEDFVCIVTDNEDRRNGGVAMIYLIRMED